MHVDGKQVPVADVLVEPYRIDVDSGKSPATKTNKNGEFSFAGFPLGHKFVLALSGATISPAISPTVQGGMEAVQIVVFPGDGKLLSEAEVRAAAKKSPEGVSTASETDRKKLEAENAKILERNKKAEDTNKIVNAVLKEGNDAFTAKNYELAISKYNEGIAADPDFIGSAPIFHNNKGAAYRSSAIDIYNSGVKLADATEKLAAMGRAKKALADSADSYAKGFNLLKNAPAAEIKEQPNYEATKMVSLAGAVDTFKIAVKTSQVDPVTVETAKLLVPEYLTVEKDAAKKSEASLVTADLYRIAEDRENAIAAYKKVLENSPENVDAMAYLGIVLVDLGWLKDNDKALSQEGANYLQKFVAVAPDAHPLKSGAVEYLGILKTQNIVPVKATTPARKRP
jgi:tetratricopeptide (TPR) repeat protein